MNRPILALTQTKDVAYLQGLEEWNWLSYLLASYYKMDDLV